MQPIHMWIILTFLLLICINIPKILNKSPSLIKLTKSANTIFPKQNKESPFLEIAICFLLVFWLQCFSAVIGPYFFQGMGFTVNNTSSSNIITAFDATSCFTSSLLTVVIGYMFLRLSPKN